ncbi:hypothetical protein K502DRAFT_348678 [Neoconidiobolus thromboides FSU 785]|nr:hypothetical protein K502DRAFT_348678 [Neoconidiobolus thromboides FSU 785]
MKLRYNIKQGNLLSPLVYHSTLNKPKLDSKGNKILRIDSEKEFKKATPYQLQLAKTINGVKEDINNYLDNGILNSNIYSKDIILKEPYHSGIEIKGKKLYLLLAKFIRTTILWYYQDVVIKLTHFQLRPSGEGNGEDFINKSDDFEMKFLSIKEDNKDNMDPSHLKNILKASQTSIYPLNPTSLLNSIDPPTLSPTSDSSPYLLAKMIIEGTPRPALLLPTSTEPRKTYHVVFIYTFDNKGFIKLHKVQKIYPNPSNLRSLFPKWAWWWWLRNSKPELSLFKGGH